MSERGAVGLQYDILPRRVGFFFFHDSCLERAVGLPITACVSRAIETNHARLHLSLPGQDPRPCRHPPSQRMFVCLQMMNAMGDHSMATRKAFVPFLAYRPELDELVGGDWSALDSFPEWARCRLVAMRPGGPVAKLMAAHAASMKVGERRAWLFWRVVCTAVPLVVKITILFIIAIVSY